MQNGSVVMITKDFGAAKAFDLYRVDHISEHGVNLTNEHGSISLPFEVVRHIDAPNISELFAEMMRAHHDLYVTVAKVLFPENYATV